jgi:diaminopimelate epimerase
LDLEPAYGKRGNNSLASAIELAVPNVDFLKMHGCGNDFIVFDDSDYKYSWEQLSALAQTFCDRRFGVGADGVIAVGRPSRQAGDQSGADYEMRYVNADGSRAEMCGNGIRCVGKFVAEEMGEERNEVSVLTGNGVLPITLIREHGQVNLVTVSMGVPRLKAEEIPMHTSAAAGEAEEKTARLRLEHLAEQYDFTGVNMGNPHAVTFVSSINDGHVLEFGPQVETDQHFPRKTNVEFVQVLSPTHLRMRVWERGCGETWACGTGACASAVAAVLEGHSPAGQNIILSLNGGDLIINWPGEGQPVSMTGPASTVFSGKLNF